MATHSFLLGGADYGDQVYQAAIGTTVEQLTSSTPTYTAFYLLVEKGAQPPTFNDSGESSVTKVSTPTIEAEGGTDVSDDFDAYAYSGNKQPIIRHNSNILVPASNLEHSTLTFVDGLPIYTIGYRGQQAVSAIRSMVHALVGRPEFVGLTAGSLSLARSSEYVLGYSLDTSHLLYAFSEENGNFVLKGELTNLQRKQRVIASDEAIVTGQRDNDGDTVVFVAGVTNLAKNNRAVTYYTSKTQYTRNAVFEALTSVAEGLTTSVSTTSAQPAPISTESSDGTTSQVDTMPTQEKRTRAQLYTALLAAERYGDRTVTRSQYEDNVSRHRSSEADIEEVRKSSGDLPQGQLVSLVNVLLDRLLFEMREAATSSRDLLAAETLANARLSKITLKGIGYDC